jgi:tetratricopeptide (TPR) repeat protein
MAVTLPRAEAPVVLDQSAGDPSPGHGLPAVEARGPTPIANPRAAHPAAPVGAVMAARRPGESDISWRLRSRDLDLRYQSATEALAQAHYADALIWLSAILEEDASYRNAPELLEGVYRARRGRAADVIREGLELERTGQLRAAASAYDRALAIDPELAAARERLTSVQATIGRKVADAKRRASLASAFGLAGDAAAALTEVLQLVPQGSAEARGAEAQMAALGPPARPLLIGDAPASVKLDLLEATEALEHVEDAGGRFIVRLPTRRWQLTRGSGSTIGIVTESSGRGSLLVETVALADRVSLDPNYDDLVRIESGLVRQREPAATVIVHRRLDPPQPMIVLDYRRPAPGGQFRRVRQFSILRGQTLYRISATNGVAPFYEVEGVFNEFALSFQPTDRGPLARP